LGIVHGHGRSVEIARPEQADHAVAQVLPLKEQEHDDNEDDAHVGERRDHGTEHLLGQGEG
jgi:hypothetical protein